MATVVASPIEARKLGEVMEILEAARRSSFDPNSEFRAKHGYSPWDLLEVVRTFRVGFDNYVVAKSISPPLDEPVLLRFTSARVIPLVGDLFSLNEQQTTISIFDRERFETHKFKVIILTSAEFESAQRQCGQ